MHIVKLATLIGFFLSLLTSALLVLSFPCGGFSLLAWLALVPLLLALPSKTLLSIFALSFFSGTIFYAGVSYWLLEVGSFHFSDLIALAAYFSVYFSLFMVGYGYIVRKKMCSPMLAAPLLWVSLEYLRSHAGLLAFPGLHLSHTQYQFLPIIQFGEVTGAYGISFLIILVNVAIAQIIIWCISKNRADSVSHTGQFFPLTGTLVTIGVVSASLIYGYWSLSSKDTVEKVQVCTIQGNISQHIKWDPEHKKEILNTHVELSKMAGDSQPAQLYIWPETSVYGALIRNHILKKTLVDLAIHNDAALLVGVSQKRKFQKKDPEQQKKWFNSAVLFSPEGKMIKQYNKTILLPFGEYLPYKNIFPWPKRYHEADQYVAGDEYTLFSLSGVPFAALICWESIFPDFFRQFVKEGARFMVNITNEAWFGNTAAPYYFLSTNVFRAVENRVAIVRAANTGISCFIDPDGRISGAVEKNGKNTFIEGFLTREVPLRSGSTFYTRYGNVFALLCMAGSVSILVISFLKKHRQETD